MDKLTSQDGQSLNIVADNIERLREIFPTAFAEGRVDFEALKQCLGECVDERTERYSFTWHGKRCARRIAQTPSAATLLPCPDESLNWDITQNIFIEGDNLEVLKLLQKSYHRKVKMIYIDPPYNTGKEFIYPDNYQDNLGTYLKYTGQIDGEGCKLSPNTESGGRYHTNWLNMMYPRLILARNLLRDDGVMFVSIDDHEVHNLRYLMDEVYGPENFVASVIWEKKYSPSNDAKWLSENHDYVLLYAKSKHQWRPRLLPRTEKQLSRYSNRDNDRRGRWKSGGLDVKSYIAQYDYPITTPSGRIVNPPAGSCWRVSKEKFAEMVSNNRIYFGESGENVPSIKRFLSEVKDGITPVTIWKYKEVGHNQLATQELKKLFGQSGLFETPKPVSLVQRMIYLSSTNPNDIVLDFFAGSGTTGHAVMNHSQQDGNDRRFILIQLPEACPSQSRPSQAGFQNLAEVSRDRLRRTIAQSDMGEKEGFKVFKLSSSNIKPWDPDCDAVDGALLDAAIDNIKPERSQLAVLYELLLKYGLDLASAIEIRTIADRRVFIVANGALVVCLERGINLEVVRGIAALKTELQPPLMRMVFRDSGFDNDVLKTNALQILTQAGIPHVKSL